MARKAVQAVPGEVTAVTDAAASSIQGLRCSRSEAPGSAGSHCIAVSASRSLTAKLPSCSEKNLRRESGMGVRARG
jgi:hypothetical protein